MGTSGVRSGNRVAEVERLIGNTMWSHGGRDKDLQVILRAKGNTWQLSHQRWDILCLGSQQDPSDFRENGSQR